MTSAPSGTFPLFLRAFSGGDDAEHVRRFHRRLTKDAVANEPPLATHAVIDGIPVPELLERMRTGDRTALATVYGALFEPLWRVAVLQTNVGEVAEDLVHDVFLWMWTHCAAIPATTDLRVYLAAAVRNRARNLGKHARVVENTMVEESSAARASGLGAPLPPTDASVDADDFMTAYQRALSLLSERELTAALLRWEQGFTLDQIGSVLGVSARGALGIVTRAQTKVQEALHDFR